METYSEYLQHHGILGMRWGKRNGPPYPLGPSQMSGKERRLNNKIPDVVITKPKHVEYDRKPILRKKEDDLRLYRENLDNDKTAYKENIHKAFEKYDDYKEAIDEELCKYLAQSPLAEADKVAEIRALEDEYLSKNADWKEYENALYKFFGNKLDSNSELKDLQKETAKEFESSLKKANDIVDGIISEHGDYPVANFGKYKEVTYKDLVKRTLDSHDEKGEAYSLDKHLLNGDPYGNIPPVSKMLFYDYLGAMEEHVSHYSSRKFNKELIGSSGSPSAFLKEKLGKYNPKWFDPEMADLTLMEYEDVTGKTISDSEWSKIIDEYKKS